MPDELSAGTKGEEPRTKRIAAAARAAPDGPVPPELDRLRADRTLHCVTLTGAAQIVALLFLMSVKPGITGCLITSAAATALSQAIAATAHRRHHETGTTPPPPRHRPPTQPDPRSPRHNVP